MSHVTAQRAVVLCSHDAPNSRRIQSKYARSVGSSMLFPLKVEVREASVAERFWDPTASDCDSNRRALACR